MWLLHSSGGGGRLPRSLHSETPGPHTRQTMYFPPSTRHAFPQQKHQGSHVPHQSIKNLTLVASCFLGAFPPVDLRAVCLVRAIVTLQPIHHTPVNKTQPRTQTARLHDGRRGEDLGKKHNTKP